MAPNILPGAPSVVADAPQVKVGADAFNRAPTNVPEQGLAAAFEKLGSGLEDLAVPLAKQAGQQDGAAAGAAAAAQLQQGADGTAQAAKGVGLDANGMPVVFTPANNFILGRPGEAYTQASRAGTEAALSSAISERMTDIHLQHQADPDGFRAATDAFADHWKATYPGQAGIDLANQVHDLGAQHYATISQKDQALSLNNDKTALTTQIDTIQNKMQLLARNGGIATPAYDQYQDQLQDAYDNLGTNRLFGYGPERADSELSQALSTNRAEYVIGQVDTIYNKSGKAAAAKALNEGILNNPDLDLPTQERSRLVNFGLAHLDYLTNEQRIKIDASRETTAPFLEMMRTDPRSVTPAMVSQAKALATAANDTESRLKIEWEESHLPSRAAMAGMTDQQRVLHQAVGGDYVSKVGMQEGGGRADPGGNGGGQFQFQPGTWAAVAAKHPDLGLTPDGRTDPAQSARAIVAFTNDNKAALQAAGIAPTDANTYMAHFLGAGGATSFIKAMQADPNQPAAALNLKAATANPTIFYKPGADGKPDFAQPRTLQEVYALQTRRFGDGTTPVVAAGVGGAPTPEQMARNPYALAMYVRDHKADAEQEVKSARNVGETLVAQYGKAATPPAYVTAAVLQLTDKYPEQLGEIGAKIRNLAAGAEIGEAINNDPTPAARQTHLAQVEAWMRTGDLNSMAKAETAKLYADQGAKRLKEDPYNELVTRRILTKSPTPPDLSTPEGIAALPQSFAEHAQAAVALSAFNGKPASLFSPAEEPVMRAAYQNGTAAQKVAMATALLNTRVSQPILDQTFRSLGANPVTSPLAVAGDVARTDPITAQAIVAGQGQLAAEPKLTPKNQLRQKFAEALPFNDVPDGRTRQAYEAALGALYANKSGMQTPTDTSGILDEGRFDAALEGVTGGIRDWRGSKVFAPWPGATQEHLDGAIRSVTNADLVNAVGRDGVSLPASALLPSMSGIFSSNSRFRLESSGPGKYLIFSGPDQHDQRQYLLDKRTAGTPNPQRFVLDLGAKKDEAIARAAGPLSHTPFSDRAGSSFLNSTNFPVGFQ